MLLVRHRRLYDLVSSEHFPRQVIDEAIVVQRLLLAHAFEGGALTEGGLGPALSLENALCNQLYPQQAFSTYERLASVDEPEIQHRYLTASGV